MYCGEKSERIRQEILNSGKYGKCSEILNTFLFLVSKKCWLSELELTKCLSEKQTGKTLIRLLFQKQSDLGLPCLSRSMWQEITVRNLRTFTVHGGGKK